MCRQGVGHSCLILNQRRGSQKRAGVGLGIQVDEQDAVAGAGQGVSEVEGSRCLADPALLIGDRDDMHVGFSFL